MNPMPEIATREALLEQVWEVAERVIGAWRLERPVVQLLEHKKNATFKVDAADGRYVLRVCDPDGYGEAEIRSEMQYLTALHAATGLVVPQPVAARDGSLVVRAAAQPPERPRWCALFRWVPGRMVQDAPTPRRLEQVGEISAQLHRFAAEWQPPAGFTRPRWDAAGLFGKSGSVLAPGQGAPVVGERARELLDEAARVVRKVMADLGEGREVFGLIHKDLEPDNTLVEIVDGVERVRPIDFADVGWGHYLYDIAAALLPLREKPGFAGMLEAFLRGYRRIRPLSAEHAGLVETFLIARSIFSARLMTGRLWDLPHIREYAETAVPQILGGIRVFLERRTASAAASTRTTVQVLSLLRERGVKLWAEGEKLKYSAPPGALTAELLAEIKERKTELLGFLRQGDAARRAGAPARIEAAHRERPPLSFAQQRLWFIHQLFPESVEYNIARAVRLRGQVRVELLAASLREVVRRHGTLRTTIAVADDLPVQIVAPTSEIGLPVADLTALPVERREPEAWRLAREDARRPFDLERGPLLRVFLLRLDDTDTIAPSTMHHVIGDGWSSGILFREMGLIYAALARGEAPSLPPLPIQYTDFAVWQREWLTGEVLAEQLGWWTQELSGAPQELALPTDRPRSASAASHRGDRRSLLIPHALAESLKAFSQAQGATLFMILLAAWNTLLCRLSGQDDVVIGSPIANRNRTEIEGLIGCFVNTLALRAIFRGNPTFREVLASARKTTLGAYAHQDLPFEKIVEELRPERSLTQTPLFQVIFTLQNVPSPDMEVADFRMTLMPPTSRAATFDLALNMKEMPEGVRTSFMFKEDLFDGATVERLAACYLRLLEAVAVDPNQRIRELPLLSPAEALQLQTWGGVRAVHEIAPDETLAALFAARVRQSPGSVAVTWEGNALTYAELNDRAEQLARRLLRLGVGPEDRVGLCAERSLELLIGMVGIAKAGAAYVPLDPAYPKERLAFLIEDAGVRVVVGTEEALAGLPAEPQAAPLRPHPPGPPLPSPSQPPGEGGIATLIVQQGVGAGAPLPVGGRAMGEGTGVRSHDGDFQDARSESTAYVIYTSGSTGRPKGVMVTHANVIRLLRATEASFGFGPDDVWTLFHSYAFDFSVWEIWGALLTGGRIVVVPYEVSRSPQAFHELLAGERVTVLNQTPTAFAELVRADEDGNALPDLRLVIFGGEALALSGLVPWFARHGDETPRLVNMYGITETTVHVTYRPLMMADAASGTGSMIGLPLSDLSVHVLDATGQPAPVGVPGEMTVGGAGLARGYLGRPELTAERFVPDPFGPQGSRLYRSGDLGRFLASGELEYLGRIDHQVKIRGFRIEPGEIEAALLAHSGVRQAVVLALDNRLAAFVVASTETPPRPSELRGLLAGTLPEHLVPSTFVLLDALPLTGNGKVDRKALAALAEAPGSSMEDESFVTPRGPVEELLAGIFAEILKLGEIGAQADFFALGGHSLLATQVVSRVRQALGVELPLRSLFTHPVLSDLAREIEALRRAGEGAALPPIGREADRGAVAPLSFAQERMWFLHRLAPERDTYNVAVTLLLDGGLLPGVAARALGEVVRRHEVLRTVIVEGTGVAPHPLTPSPIPLPPPGRGGNSDLEGVEAPLSRVAGGDGRGDGGEGLHGAAVLQLITPPAPFDLPLCDLSHLPEERRELEMRRLAEAEAGRPFDLQRGPVLRALLVRLAERRHAATLTLHHIATDGWSTGILVREFCTLYRAFALGEPSPLAELPVQYADYAVWQRRWLAGPALEQQLAYWRQRLGFDPPPLDLPSDRPRSRDRAWDGAVHRFTIAPGLAEALNRFSRGHSVTLFMTLLAAWTALLARLSGEAVIRVGTPVANRRGLESEGLIGLFVNTLVLATDVSGAPSFAALLARIRETSLEAHAHQDAPFDRLVEELVRERDLSRSPLFQVLFALQNAPAAVAELPDLHLTQLPGGARSAMFDLGLQLEEDAAGLSAQLDFSTDLYDAVTVERLASHFTTLLAAAVEASGTAVAELPLLPEAEWRQLLAWGGAHWEIPVEETLADLFAAQVRRAPGARAVTCEGNELTYAELDTRADRLARRLRRLGVGPEERVGLCAERSLELVVGMLAVVKAGGAYLPLDPAYPRERLAFLIENAGVRVVVGTETALAGLPSVETAVCPDDLEDDDSSVTPLTAASPQNLAYVIYTSGSTGRPKGVAVTHANVVRLLRATEPWFGFGPDDVWTLFHSYAFDFSVWEIWGALLYGGRLVVVPYTVSRTPEAFHDLLEAERVTVLNQTPTAFAELMRADADPARADTLAALRLVIFGGEALVPSSLADWFARHGDAQPRLINMYGITETTVFVTYRPLSAAEEQDGPGSVIGIPIPDLAVHVLDITGQPVPIGVPGELMIGGAGLARGYVGRPDLTAERFVPDPFSGRPGACLYRSGDLGRFLPAGEIEYFGRIDHQVKIRGFRIEPGEIEAALLALPGVRQAVVLLEAGRLLAFIVLVIPAAPEAEAQPNVSTLRPLLAATLPEHMVPSAFVVLDALPRTANGKVDRKALLASWATSASAAPDEEGFIAPRDPVEELLAGIFAEVLGIDTVGAEAHFFALGGHSLLATQVVSRVRRDLGVELPLRLLFEEPTVGGLAARLREALAASSFDLEPWAPIPRRDTGVAAPLSFAQERLWFLDQMTPGSPIYNIPGALALAGRLDVTALAAAFAAVVRRHEGPRTVFRAPAGEPFQVVLPAVPPPLPVVDLTALPAAARGAEAARQQDAEAMRGFDLANGPLFRACLLRLAHSSDETDRHVLLLTFHHIVFDGWSTGVLARELSALYDAALAGHSAQLPELPIQYADFASWQRTRFTGATLERFAGYWRQRLTGVPPLRLPLDRPRPPLQSYSGSGEPLALTALSEAVRRLARQRTATPFMVGLAAYAALLSRASGQSDFAVGTWVANRIRPELEGLIGFFVNNLALRFEVSGSASFGELLEQVREVALGAYAHQELPFEKLIEDLKLPRDLSLPPVFQVVCVQPPPAGRLELSGLRLGIETAAGDRAHVDLSLGLAGLGDSTGGSPSCTLVYNHELFDRATIARLSRAFERLLAAALAGTTTPVSELPLLSPAEAWQLAGEWSRGLPSPALRRAPGIGFVHQLIERQVALRPDAEAVVWPGSPGSPEERVTFGDLNARANRLARLLRRRGVGPETRVALWLPRSVDAVVSILAVLKAGGCYVPLDTAYSGERLAFMAADAQARVVLTRGEAGALAGATGAAVVRLDDPAVTASLVAESAADLAPEETGLAPADSDHLAYVIYTSGSTGRPKGTMIGHRSLLTAYYAYERAYRLRDVTCHLQMASLSFDVFTGDFIRALGSGARLVLCPREVLLDPERLFSLMRAERVDGAEFVPAVVRTLVGYLEHSGGDLDSRLDFMRLLVVSSDAWYAGEVAALARLCGPRTRLIDSYGVTEATIDTTFLALAAGDGTPCLPVPTAAAVVPIGRPLAGNEVWVLGGIDLLPPRLPGELCIGGDGVARGYLGRPELTAEKFTPHPFSTTPGARLYRAGDLARWLPDGSVEFLGRVDNQIKVRGFRIEPGEIEAVLATHPRVRQAVVLALAGSDHLAAYVVVETPPDAAELRAFALERLPDYMVPAVFVPLSALPLTPNGKVDRKALPVPEVSVQTAEPVPPRGPVEELLAGIFSEVLADVLRSGPIGADANFFALGGHSLLATQVVSRVRRALGVELPLRLLFEAPTVALLARAIEDLRGADRGPVLPPPPPIVPRPEGAPAPLSFAQERMWFLHRFAPQSDAYNISLALHLDGGLRPGVAARALGEIVRRHEVLRTVVVEGADLAPHPLTPSPIPLPPPGRGGNLDLERVAAPLSRVAGGDGRGDGGEGLGGAAVLQISHPPSPIPLPLCDLAGLPPERRAAEARRITGAEAARPFDLTHGPVLRVLLVRLAERLHTAVLTVHHIATDGWSMSLLVREFCALYRAFAQGEPSPLAELPVQYADYAAWQRRWLAGAALDGQIAWWRQRLGVDAPPLDLPADRPRSVDRAWGGGTRRLALAPPALTGQINRLSRQSAASLFMTLLAAWTALLARLTGQSEIRVGTPVANRPGVEVEGLIGLFLNTLVLATDTDNAPSFRDLLDRVRSTSLEAHAHQDAPFDRLVEELVRERDLSRSPLFQVLFVVQNMPGAAVELPDLRLTQLASAAHAANFDLALMIEEGSAGLSVQLDYSTDLFDATTIDRLVRCYRTLLAAAVAAPGTRIAELPLLPAEEEQQILLEWNDGVLDVQRGDPCAHPSTLHALFEAQVRRSPGALALSCAGEVLTYGELNARANRLAHHLLWLGVEPEVGVGLCADRSIGMVVGLLGILKSGGAYVPLDPTYPRERLAFLMEDAGVQVVIGPERSLARVPVPAEGIAINLDHLDGDFARYPDTDPQSLAVADNIAYVIYTSGSTGRPKGVLVTHGSAARYVLWTAAAYAVDRHAGSCVHTSLAFDLTVTSLLTPLLAGVPVHLVPDEADLDGLARAVEATGYGFLKLTPAHLELLRSESAAFAAADPLTLVVGGEALHGAALRDWPPTARIVNEYGPTEATVGCSAFAVAASAVREGPVPIGRPVAGARLYVLSEAMRATPIGAPGELWIGGSGLARGYLSRPDLTAERFVPDPFEPGARLYRTGDRARWRADGELEFLGRLDEQVKVRGFRIEPGEVEAALASLPGVESAVVLARPAQEGDGQKRLVAWVVGPAGQGALGGEGLRRQLLERLPEHMVPAVIVPLDALPLTANGKVDRKALPEPGTAPAPEAARSVAPRNRTEELLAEVWQQVLGQRGTRRIGVHDSFFQLGGDSILSLQVVSRAARAGLRFTPRQLFERPTIAELALVAMLVAEPKDAGPMSGPASLTTDQERFFAARTGGAAGSDISIEDLYPLSPVQQGLLFHSLHAPESGAYVVQVSVGFGAAFDVAAFERSWQQMAERHPVLRTAFAWLELDEPLQAVHAHLPLRWERQDWRGLPAAEQDARLAEYLRADRLRGFDLTTPPLMRLAMFRLGAGDAGWRFVWSHHHAILDGWSMPILLHELFACYAAERQGETARLPAVRPYRDYIAWLREQDLAEAEAFWRAEMAGFTTPTPLPGSPSAAADSAGDDRPHQRRRLILPAAASEALGAFARHHQLTLNTLMQGAWALLLARHSGEEEVVFGGVTAGRGAPLPGIESMVGLFSNTLPVRVRVPGAASLIPWLQRLQERQAAARQFEYTPLSRVQAWSPVPAGTPLFDTILTFENYPLDDAVQHQAGTALAAGGVEGAEQSHYPLGLIVIPGAELSLRLLYEEARFPESGFASGERLLEQLASLLTGMLAEPADQLTVADLPVLTPAERAELLGRVGDRTKVRTAAPQSPAAGKPQYVAPRDHTEELLAEVWLQVLGGRHSGGRIGVHDSFFQLGGDSILSLQVVSRAARAGLRITPRQLLESQTIARLAPLAVPLGLQRDAVASSRPAPLLPIQERFFAAAVPHPEHYNQSLLLASGESVRGALSPHLLRQAIGHLWAHHGALRLRFLPPAAEQPQSRTWRQVSAPPVGAPPFLHIDLSALPEAARPQALAASADLLQASLDLAQGPILRAAFFGSDSGDPRQDRLLLIVHHLAVDGVSWRILAQDLEEVYRQLERGAAVELPPPATSFQHWAERLHEHAQTPAALAEAAWWLEQPLPDRPLPLDFPREDGQGAPTIASLRSVEIQLTAEETRALLEDAPRAYRTQVNDLLLTALVEAFAPWTGSRRLLLDLEGHGRENLFEDGETTGEIDLSRTVGWFTSIFPVPLDLTGIDAPGAALKAVKEQLRAVPNRGIGFGIVRWLAEAPEATKISRRLRALPVSEVSFNYLGQLAAGPAEDRLFRLAGGAAGATAHPAQPLSYLLEINGGVTGGRLWMQLGYSADRHRQATIEQLAGRFAGALRTLVAHCLEPGAGGVTPSDFPLAGLAASALDQFVVAGAPVEDIYPLSPLQQGMLFHALHAPESGAYVVQTSIRFGAGLGTAERAALERSWQQVIDRHPILRTAFRWLGLDEPLQVVSTPFPMAWEHRDWRGLPAAEQSERLAEYLRADRQRGFDLAAAPLLRLALIQLGDSTSPACQLVWTHHHAILDGWSLPLLLRELFSCYAAALQGTTAVLPPVRAYRDYIAWLRQQDLAAAEAFWRTELSAFTTPTPLPGATEAGVQDGPPIAKEAWLSPAAGEALGAFARRHQLTLNTMAQGAWALLLARASGEDDVVFGAVTAGRGAPLAGLDSMVGLFVNTLPVRARVPQRTPAAPWLLRLQESQIAARHFEHTPLAKVRAWSELPAGATLFETIYGFENYPLDEALRQDVGATVAVAGVEGTEQTHYPLAVVVQPGPRWALRLAANDPRLDTVSVARLLGHLETLLLGLIAEETANLPVAELPLLAPAERQQLLIELSGDPAGPATPAALTELFAQRAKRTPWQPAVICRGVPLTYAELDQRSATLAGFLRQSGVGPEVRVGLVVEPSLERAVGLLGILRAGGAAVPVDPTLSATEESRRVLDEAQIALLLTTQRWQSGFSAPSLVCLDRDWPQIAAESKRAGRLSDTGGHPDSLAVISTASQPPGLLLSHRSIAAPQLPAGIDAATAETLHALRTGARPPMHPFVLDRRHQPVPLGTAGDLYLAGSTLARGILNRPDLTAERFVPHPWSSEPGERLYRTGDRARRRADGTVEVGFRPP